MTRHAIKLALAWSIVASAIGCSSPAKVPSETKSEQATERPQAGDNWKLSETTEPIDGTKQTTIFTDSENRPGGSLVVRFRGEKLEIYVLTNEMVDGESSGVRIRFDDASPIKQTWGRSSNYKGIFSPQPYALVKKLQDSQKFYLEYHPYERLPETLIFQVAGLSTLLPAPEMAIQEKKYQQGLASEAALRARVVPNVHPCRDRQDRWCWSDPNASYVFDMGHYETKQKAIDEAMLEAHLGIAFNKKK